MGKPRRQTLPDLPNAIIIRIAENLSLKDLPNLASCCRALAAMADDLYRERQILDMSCFEPATVTPALCNQLIARFSATRLHKLCFRYDLRHHRTYDDDTIEAIAARFLDNVNPSTAHFQRDLRGGTPRMLEILAHCYYLDRFLCSQPCLRGLDVDVEVSIFTLISERGPRLDWHLLNPFLTLDAVGRRCSLLESYSTHASSYQMAHMDLLHVHVRFLQSCPKLRSASLVFVLGTEELATYARLKCQLALEQAVFYLPGWRVSQEQRRLNGARLTDVAARLDRLRKAVVSFRRRGCLADCRDFFAALPRIESLYLRCEFNPRYPRL
ncbi:hypothetical protein SUGI_0611610 [Cryptomeria japonica]|nr:hypothetical protein SUGI_0611610 [Cryptomeria japonica]